MQFFGHMQRSRRSAYLGQGFFVLWAGSILAASVSVPNPFTNPWIGIMFGVGSMGMLIFGSRALSWFQAERDFCLFTGHNAPVPAASKECTDFLRNHVMVHMDAIYLRILTYKNYVERTESGAECKYWRTKVQETRAEYEEKRRLVRRFGFTEIRSERKRLKSLQKQSQAA